MKEHPLLFSGPMVRAILAGEKTQTRRALKPQPPEDDTPLACEMFTPSVIRANGEMDAADVDVFGTYGEEWSLKCPYGAPGDRLWVRESIRIGRLHPRCLDGGEYMVEYVADGAEHPDANWPWKRGVLPSIFMPRGISRITLEVVSVRVERVQDISDADIAAEGVTPEAVCALLKDPPLHKVRDWAPIELWRAGWRAINGVESWDLNPWVWKIEFRRINA